MSDNKNLARHLYLVEGKTIKEIAQELAISLRTVYAWQHQYAWKKLKNAASQAPATICENLNSQLVELQNKIAAREPGNRIPTTQEAEVTRKLIVSIAAVNKKQTLAQYMQMMESFRDFVRPLNKMFSMHLAHYAGKFLNTKDQNGYAPWQLEYGAEQLAAIAPIYDELEADQPCDQENPPAYREPCTNMRDCKLESGCNWPKCKRSDELFSDDINPQPDDSWPLQPLPIPS